MSRLKSHYNQENTPEKASIFRNQENTLKKCQFLPLQPTKSTISWLNLHCNQENTLTKASSFHYSLRPQLITLSVTEKTPLKTLPSITAY